MKRSLRRLAFVLLAVLVALVGTSCSTPPTSGADPDPTPADAAVWDEATWDDATWQP